MEYFVPNPPDQGYAEVYGVVVFPAVTILSAVLDQSIDVVAVEGNVDGLEYLDPNPDDHAHTVMYGDAAEPAPNSVPVEANLRESVVPTGSDDGSAYLVPNPPLVTGYVVMYGDTVYPMATSFVIGLKPTFTPFGGPVPEVGAPVGSVAGLLYLVPNPPDHGYMEMYGLPACDTTTCVPSAFILMPAPKPATVAPLEYLLPNPPLHAHA